MLVPLLLGSDKTLASNATGQNEFHPPYFSPGNIKNLACRAHCDAFVPIGFLAIPKGASSVVRDLVVFLQHFRYMKGWDKPTVLLVPMSTHA